MAEIAKTKFLWDVNFPSWAGIPVNSQFFKYQSNTNNFRCTCSFENPWKMTEKMSIFKN